MQKPGRSKEAAKPNARPTALARWVEELLHDRRERVAQMAVIRQRMERAFAYLNRLLEPNYETGRQRQDRAKYLKERVMLTDDEVRGIESSVATADADVLRRCVERLLRDRQERQERLERVRQRLRPFALFNRLLD